MYTLQLQTCESDKGFNQFFSVQPASDQEKKVQKNITGFWSAKQILLTEQVKCYMSCLRPSVSFLNDISASFETDPDYLYKETIFWCIYSTHTKLIVS